MRYYEFLVEGKFGPADMLKHHAQYSLGMTAKIRKGEPLAIYDKFLDDVGTNEVYIIPSEAERLEKVLFGLGTDISDPSTFNVDAANNLIPADANSQVKFAFKVDQEKSSNVKLDSVPIRMFDKTDELKGAKKDFNTGDVAEGILGAAIAARFVKRDQGDVTALDVMNIMKSFEIERLPKKANLKGTYTQKVAEDVIKLTVILNGGSFKSLINNSQSGKYHPIQQNLIASAVKYVNEDARVAEANKTIIEDRGSNKVEVTSDGLGDQKGTKADLFLTVDNQKYGLL